MTTNRLPLKEDNEQSALKIENDKVQFISKKNTLMADLKREKVFLEKEESNLTTTFFSVFSFFGLLSSRQRMENFYNECEKSETKDDLMRCFSKEKHDDFYQDYLEEYYNQANRP